jgi:hypothetical protein
MRKIFVVVISAVMLLGSVGPAHASKGKRVVGSKGQILQVDKTLIRENGVITITGRKFDPSVGIYLAFCKLPKKGEAPTPCGGGINMAGESVSSIWISSNPPIYGGDLAQPFGKNGSFQYKLRLQSKIDSMDCRTTRCAITVRADHTRSSDRSQDLFIPIKFKG